MRLGVKEVVKLVKITWQVKYKKCLCGKYQQPIAKDQEIPLRRVKLHTDYIKCCHNNEYSYLGTKKSCVFVIFINSKDS